MKLRFLLIFSVIVLACASTSAAGETNFCKLTSQKALLSCQVGAQSDYLLALGKCVNVSDAAGRKACKKQASADLKDALDSCDAELSVRQTACPRLGGQPYVPAIAFARSRAWMIAVPRKNVKGDADIL